MNEQSQFTGRGQGEATMSFFLHLLYLFQGYCPVGLFFFLHGISPTGTLATGGPINSCSGLYFWCVIRPLFPVVSSIGLMEELLNCHLVLPPGVAFLSPYHLWILS